MVEQLSPLADAWRPGAHPNAGGATGVHLVESRPGSIVEVAAWPGMERQLMGAVKKAAGLALSTDPGAGAIGKTGAGFGTGPGRFLIADRREELAEALARAVTVGIGTVCDLSHGRTAITVEGPKARWVLAKLFALDFSPDAFPLGAGRASVHHDIFAAIQRTGEDRFELYVFRSFARAFWKTLCHSAEEVGYEVR